MSNEQQRAAAGHKQTTHRGDTAELSAGEPGEPGEPGDRAGMFAVRRAARVQLMLEVKGQVLPSAA